MKKHFVIIFIFFFVPLFVSAAGSVVINEIAYDLKGADDGKEWIEIYNASNQDVDATGWVLNDGTNHDLNVPPKNGGQGALTIKSGEYVILADNAVTFLADHSGFSGTVIDTVMSLGNTGATLTLIDKNKNTVDAVLYQKEWGANGNGMTLERTDPKESVWKESKQEGGTPGAQNSNYSNTGGNQFDSQNSSSQNDNQSSQSENISNNSSSASPQNLIADAGQNIAGVAGTEIVFDGSKSTNSAGGEMSYLWNFGNGETASGKIVKYAYKYPGHYIVSLAVSSGLTQSSARIEVYVYPAGIFISEFVPNPAGSDEEGEWIEIANDSDSIADISGFQMGDGSSAIFKIPKNTFIAPRSFLVFARNATKISLNNDEDKIVLRYPSGEIADSVEYKSGAKEGYAAARTSGGRFLWTKNSTPGTANIFLSEPVNKTSAAPAQKMVSENKAGDFRTFIDPNFSVVGGLSRFGGDQSNGGLISFLPEVSAKTVDGYDEGNSADANFPAGGEEKAVGSGNELKTKQSASLFDSLKNKTAAALILVPLIILSALAFIFRRKFWR